MVWKAVLLTAILWVLPFTTPVGWAQHIAVNITVPEFKVDKEDAYVCVSAALPPRPHKLIGVIPHARQEVVHHILLYGCSEPHMAPQEGKTAAWRCDMQPVCNGPSVIFYGWGRNAPDLVLPEGVGYSVGDLTGIRYIVAQVHYLAIRPADDHSGVTLVLKPHAVPYAAGMLTYASWFRIPPGKKSHLVENSCCFKSHQPLTMFAVRVHTHALGRQVYMTRGTWNRTGVETLYTRDPQLPQSFVPSTRHVLWPGDRLTVTCDFDSSNRSTVTVAGGTHNDEMCNMYVMVYGKTPYLTMCGDSQEDIRDDSPGALPRGAMLALDPSPFWKPPQPDGRVHAKRSARRTAAEEVATMGADGAPPSAPEDEEDYGEKVKEDTEVEEGAEKLQAGAMAEVKAEAASPTTDTGAGAGAGVGATHNSSSSSSTPAAKSGEAKSSAMEEVNHKEEDNVSVEEETENVEDDADYGEEELKAEAEVAAEAAATAEDRSDYDEKEQKAMEAKVAATEAREWKVDPLGAFGDATSVTAGPDGSIWVLYRASGVWQADTFDNHNRITRKQPVAEAVVARLDPDNGTVLARWGGGVFYLPHMISTDAAGNVWVVDVGRHQVLKFTPEGKLLMTVGKELIPGSGHDNFCKPSQVSVLRDGSFLVADGYCNNRVVWFDAKGRFIAESVRVPAVVHSVLVDECEGLAYVASREAGSILALHLDTDKRLQLAATYDLGSDGHGQAWALGFGPYGEQLALMWREGQDARLVNVRFPTQFWTLPETAHLSPHDFQLGGAPMQLSGAGDRFYAVYLASVGVACDKACGPLHKFVVVPPGVRLPASWELPTTSDVLEIHPGDAKLLPGGTAIAEQPHASEGEGKAADTGGSGEGSKGSGEGGAMIADDYDEEIEEDAVDAKDYEEAVKEQQEVEKREEDYERMFGGADGPGPASPAPLEKERFAVLVQDKKVVREHNSISGWALALLALLAALMAFSVLRFSKISLSAYLQEGPFRMPGSDDGRSGDPAASRGGAGGGRGAGGGAAAKSGGAASTAGAGGKGDGVWAAAEGLFSRMRGTGGAAEAAGTGGRAGGGRAAREVETARERERLLRAEP